jgi:YkoY family integral membrane protein
MFNQTFELADLASVAALIILEGLLSADNALVLAVMVKHLKKDEQKRALLYGLGGAFAFRLFAILGAGYVLKLWQLQAVGAAYLLFVPIKHFYLAYKHRDSEAKQVSTKGLSFWRTVIAVEITDIAFAVDSVLAGVTFVGNKQEKIWVVYFGAIIGIVLLRFAAGFFVRLLDRFPVLDHVAYAIVAWVGVKLTMIAAHTFDINNPGMMSLHVPEMSKGIFWGVLLAIAGIGAFIAYKNERKGVLPEDIDEIVEDVQDLVIDDVDLGENEEPKTVRRIRVED